MSFEHPIRQLLTEPYLSRQYAHSEGNNIMTWLGFKHIMYLSEQGLLTRFRELGMGFRTLFEEHGLHLEIVSNKGRILHALKMDEEVEIEIHPAKRPQSGCLGFDVRMFVEREGKRVKTYSGNIQVVLKQDETLGLEPISCSDSALAPYITNQGINPNITSNAPIPLTDIDGRDIPRQAHSLLWRCHIPYFYCHGNERLKMSGYLRLMEEADELFCAQQGISINSLLKNKRWIPAVPDAEVNLINEAYMEESLYVVYEVKDIIKEFLYKSEMRCYVARNDSFIHVATGAITHAYAEIHNRKDWSMVNFDQKVIQALTGESA